MRTHILYLFAITTCFQMSGQVGINTTTPDPSSILDVTSTTGGILTPRMTTAQRELIASPAQGLFVYDTDEESFYFFDGQWNPLNSSVKRDNYKLVKDVTDLADELVAGGGAKYLLNSNFLYELNGTILIDFPIELNGAFITGRDGLEDRIFNNSGNSLFTGTTGGNLKRLTIIGNGQEIFNIKGSGSDNLVTLATNFVGASSVGSLTDMGLVFFNTGQFQNNTTGLTASNITSLFVNLILWNTNNTGTFMTLSGSFDDIQFINGRIVSDAGEKGLDVSGNPTIGSNASMTGVDFTGDGTRVDGYTVGSYPDRNFTVDWDVNCPGIPIEIDAASVGDINFNFTAGGGAGTTFASSGTPVKMQGATTSNRLFRFDESGDNRIVYKGKRTRFFNVTASISFQGDTPGDRYIFYVAKGAPGAATPTVVDETGVWRQIGGTFDIGAVALTGTIEMVPDSYLEVWVERFSGSGGIFTISLNLAVN